jgi:hypothetical protein
MGRGIGTSWFLVFEFEFALVFLLLGLLLRIILTGGMAMIPKSAMDLLYSCICPVYTLG